MSAGKTTFASHPGNISAHLLRYVRYFPGPTVLPITVGIAGLACPLIFGLKFWWVTIGAILLALARLGPFLSRARLQFRHGCLNPAVVLQSKPLMLAVYTDLMMRSDNSCPVVKIIHHPRLF